MPHARLSFDSYDVDLGEERLLHNKLPLRVTRQSFAVLSALLARPGLLLTKQDLFREAWGDRVVSDAALTRCIRELRLAMKDDAHAPRYIETVHGRGFRFVAKVVVQSTAEPQPAGGTVRLVGREAELQQLQRALDKARGQECQIVLVNGEAGIGKTTTVESFVASSVGNDVWIAQGRCIEQYGAQEPYLPLLEALQHLAHTVGERSFGALLLQHAPTWLMQLPSLTTAAQRALLQRQMAGATPARMLREITQALHALAALRVVIVWLEDLQWSDHATLDVLSFLAASRDPARLLVIATYRPGDVIVREHPLWARVKDLQVRGRCQELALDFLSQAAVREFVVNRLGL